MEDIINQLAQFPDIRVPSATSMLYYRDNPKPYDEIIEELDVAYLLEASVRKMEGKAIMNITLIDAEHNEQIWSERMEMDLSVKDLFDVQYEVANAVASKMRIAMENTKEEVPTTSYQAYDNFTKARDLMKIWDLNKNRKAINLLQEALKLDNKFLNAYVLLGQAYGQRAELSDGGSWVDSVRYYSTIAYDINSHDAGAINALGYANVLGGKPLKGLELYLQAIEINPNTPYNYAGWCYWQLGEFDKAVFWADKTIKQDPKNSIYYIDMTNACNALGLFEYTQVYSLKARAINSTHTFAADSQREMEFLKGNYSKAIDYSRQAFEVSGVLKFEAFVGVYYYKLDSLENAFYFLNNNFRESFNEITDDENSKIELYELMQYQALVNLKFKDEEKGKKQLEDLAYTIETNVSNNRPEKFYLLAGCTASLGNLDKSLEYLNKVIEMGYYNYYAINTNSLLEPLYGNEQYEIIIKKIKAENDKMRDKVLEADILTK
jgi:tetratricopeptide (TPR) repeat protein